MLSVEKIDKKLEKEDDIIISFNECPALITKPYFPKENSSVGTVFTIYFIRQSTMESATLVMNEYQLREYERFMRKLSKDEVFQLTKDCIMDYLPIKNYKSRIQTRIRAAICDLGNKTWRKSQK